MQLFLTLPVYHKTRSKDFFIHRQKCTRQEDKYYGYGIGFDRHGSYSHPSGGTGRNVIIFCVDTSSSTKIDNRNNDILILDKGPIQGLEH